MGQVVLAAEWDEESGEDALGCTEARARRLLPDHFSHGDWAGQALGSLASFLDSTATMDTGDVCFGSGFPKGGLGAHADFQP